MNIATMVHQLLLGTLIMLVSVMFGAMIWWALSKLLVLLTDWVNRPPTSLKTILLFVIIIACTMAIITFGVWVWALTFILLGAFSDLEEAVYFSMVAYTTLGLGDVVVPKQWRLLGGMTGANGFLVFGMLTAMLTDSIREIRGMHRTES